MEGVLILLGVGTVGTMMAALAYSASKRDARRKVWAAVAAERGGSFHEPAGWLKRENERIEITTGPVRMVLDAYCTGGKRKTHYTRCTAWFRHGRGPRCRVYREGVLAALGKALGSQDVTLGTDPGFDDLFVVKCDDPAAVRRLWSAPAMARMCEGFAPARVESDGFRVKLVEVGIYTEAARLHAALDLLAELAGRDLYGTEAMRAVAGPGFVDSDRGRPRADFAAPAPVVLGPQEIDGQLVTVVRLTGTCSAKPIQVEVDERGSVSLPDLARALPQGANAQLARTGAGSLVVAADNTYFAWRSIQTDPAALRAGAELLGTFAASSVGGAYR